MTDREPVLLAAILVAASDVLLSFVSWGDAQEAAVRVLVSAVAAFWARSRVTSPATLKKLRHS